MPDDSLPKPSDQPVDTERQAALLERERQFNEMMVKANTPKKARSADALAAIATSLEGLRHKLATNGGVSHSSLSTLDGAVAELRKIAGQ